MVLITRELQARARVPARPPPGETIRARLPLPTTTKLSFVALFFDFLDGIVM